MLTLGWLALGWLALEGMSAASAQSVFGDDKLSYDDGVVYDDDLVPGRDVDTPFLSDEAVAGSGASAADNAALTSEDGTDGYTSPSASPNLIGRDGRLRD